MIQAIFYKEWIKTRWYWLLATLFMIGITGYSMLRIGPVSYTHLTLPTT